MAQMYPPDPPADGPGIAAEREVWHALSALPDDWFVYSRLPFVERRTAHAGEADFLVLNREAGALVIEVKGHGVKRDGLGRWVREYAGETTELRRDPWTQASDHSNTLRRILEERLARVFPHQEHLPLVLGHAVAFPFAQLDAGELPLDVTPELLYDSRDLDSLARRVPATLKWFRKRLSPNFRPFPQPEFKKFRRQAILPVLHLVECLGAAIRSEERSLVRLSAEQAQVFRGVLDNPRLRVRGGAGTGKTVLALDTARRLAEDGQSVLLLCFNRLLGDFLAREAASWGLPEGAVQATNFHRFCLRAAEKTGGDWTVPEDPQERRAWWEDDAPLRLLEAVEAGVVTPVDAVVVDEGQDFAATWWDAIDELVKGGSGGRVLAFYDPSQEVFGRGCHVPERGFFSYTLNLNFRNTRAIGRVVSALGRVEMTSAASCPEGEPPVVEGLVPRSKELRARLGSLVKQLMTTEKLAPEQIVILTPHRREHSALQGLTELGGLPLTENPDRRQGAILHLTISAFKGLESDVIILADVDPEDPRCGLNDRYVAASRARFRLFVLGMGDWTAS